MSSNQNIQTITPFSSAVLEKLVSMAEKGMDPEKIREFVEIDLKQFNAIITSQQNDKIAIEVVERLSRGQTFAKIIAEPHMPPENIIRAAISNCREANDRLMAMNALTRKNIVNQALEALTEMASLSMKDGVSKAQAAKIRNLKLFIDAARQSAKDGLISSVSEDSKPDYLSMARGVDEARIEGVALDA